MLIRIVCILKSLKKRLFSKRTKNKIFLFLWTLYYHKLLLCTRIWHCSPFHTRSFYISRLKLPRFSEVRVLVIKWALNLKYRNLDVITQQTFLIWILAAFIGKSNKLNIIYDVCLFLFILSKIYYSIFLNSIAC